MNKNYNHSIRNNHNMNNRSMDNDNTSNHNLNLQRMFLERSLQRDTDVYIPQLSRQVTDTVNASEPYDNLFSKKIQKTRILIDSDMITTTNEIIPVQDILIGRLYQIVSIGNTDFTLVGSTSNIIGTEFIAYNNTGQSDISSITGDGTVKVISNFNNNDLGQGEIISKNTYNFTVNFNKNNGFSIFKNIIGVNLIRANILYDTYHINETNNKLIIEFNNEDYVVILQNNSYESEDQLITDIVEQINSQITGANIETNTTKTYFDENFLFFVIEDHNSSYDVIFNFRKSFEIYKSIINEVLGFNITDKITLTKGVGNKITSTRQVNLSIPYIDIVIPELPYNVCKQNAFGSHIIERVPINVNRGSMIHFEKLHLYDINYFFPITLDKINIQLYTKHNIPYIHDVNNNYEIEIVTLNN